MSSNLLSLQHCTSQRLHNAHSILLHHNSTEINLTTFQSTQTNLGTGHICSANMPSYHSYSDYSICKLNHCYKPLMCNLHEVSVIYLVLFLSSYVWNEPFLVPTFYPNMYHQHNEFKVIILVLIMAFLHFSTTNPNL